MRVDLLSRHLPDPEGTAAGRVLQATADGLLGEGVDLRVTSWSPTPPRTQPDWLSWTPLPAESAWRTRGRALLHPRSDVRLLGWTPAGTAVADDPLSAPALPPGGVATVHYATALDVLAMGVRHVRPKDAQDVRAERRVRRGRVLTYSERVAYWTGGLAVPAALRIPDAPLPLVDRPVAALVADWGWAPNRVALQHLLAAWAQVRVPGARLLLAGRGGSPVTADGVTWLGEVPDVREVLEQAALLVFPCPGTSGPKVKVLEAAAAGLPVLTTPSGAEGVATDALHVTGLPGFAGALQALLADPGRRAAGALRAREQVAAVHGPGPAARARLQATQRLQRHEQAEQEHDEPR